MTTSPALLFFGRILRSLSRKKSLGPALSSKPEPTLYIVSHASKHFTNQLQNKAAATNATWGQVSIMLARASPQVVLKKARPVRRLAQALGSMNTCGDTCGDKFESVLGHVGTIEVPSRNFQVLQSGSTGTQLYANPRVILPTHSSRTCSTAANCCVQTGPCGVCANYY